MIVVWKATEHTDVEREKSREVKRGQGREREKENKAVTRIHYHQDPE
jgi:hypothetical protein